MSAASGGAVPPAAPAGMKYPMALGISYLFLVGYVVRSVFVAVGLPASVGVMFTGFSFEYFSQDQIIAARDDLQELAFFLVLLIAGLEIDLAELRPHVFVMAIFPAALEMVGITLYACYGMGWAVIEGMVLSAVLVSLGDGLVIPKMKEFGDEYPKHPMPRLVFMWAPLEASFALTAFGILTGFSAPNHVPQANMGSLVFSNVLRVIATLLCGATLGCLAGLLIPRREELAVNGRQLFNGSSVEAFLMILAVTLLAFALGKGEDGQWLVPMGFAPGSLFQPELLVIITGTCFSYFAESAVLHEVERITGGVWVFGQLILFSMLGSKTSPAILPLLIHVVPIMACGWVFRFVGVLIGIVSTVKARGCTSYETVLQDSIFCFLSCLPRASIQGALGAVPLKSNFFSEGFANPAGVQEFIFTAARLYIITTAIGGMIILNTIGPQMLKASAQKHAENPINEEDYQFNALEEDEEEAEVAVGRIATTYGVDAGAMQAFLRSARVSAWRDEGEDEPDCLKTDIVPKVRLKSEFGEPGAVSVSPSMYVGPRGTYAVMDDGGQMVGTATMGLPRARRNRGRNLTMFDTKTVRRKTAAGAKKESIHVAGATLWSDVTSHTSEMPP